MILTKSIVKEVIHNLESEYLLNKDKDTLIRELKVLLLKYEMYPNMIYDILDDAIVKLLLLYLYSDENTDNTQIWLINTIFINNNMKMYSLQSSFI